MAQKVHIELVDDLDGSTAEETVAFGLDGHTYEIDLSKKNAEKLRKALVGFTNVARKTKGGGKVQLKSVKTGPSASEVREWARSNGHTVPDRGRIPAEVTEAFAAAH